MGFAHDVVEDEFNLAYLRAHRQIFSLSFKTCGRSNHGQG